MSQSILLTVDIVVLIDDDFNNDNNDVADHQDSDSNNRNGATGQQKDGNPVIIDPSHKLRSMPDKYFVTGKLFESKIC